MGELKPSWKLVKFGEVVRLNRDKSKDPEADGLDRYVGLEHIEPGDLRVRSWGDVADGTTFTNRFGPGQVLFGKRRAYQRKVAVADFDGVCSGDIYVLEPKDGAVLSPELLPYICHTDAFFQHAIGTSAGSLSPRTNWKSLAGYQFLLPPPSVQRQLVEDLDATRRVFEAALKVRTQLDLLEQAVLKERFPESDTAATQAGELLKLGSVADVELGYKVSPVKRGTPDVRTIVTVAQVQDGWFDLSNEGQIEIPARMVEQNLIREGDLLLTEGGDIDKLGRGAIWTGSPEGRIFQNHVFAVRPDQARVKARYLEALMRSPYGRRFFHRMAKRTSNLATISKRRLVSMPVPVPPLADQEYWLERYGEVRAAMNSASERLTHAEALHRSLVNQRVGRAATTQVAS